MKELFPPQMGVDTQPEGIPKARFELGEIVLTREAVFSLEIRERHWSQLIARHVEGDWGDIDDHDKMENEQSADQGGGRIFSAYNIDDGRFYVITEWDRSVTTVLLPDEY